MGTDNDVASAASASRKLSLTGPALTVTHFPKMPHELNPDGFVIYSEINGGSIIKPRP